jgi:hypothetical protein
MQGFFISFHFEWQLQESGGKTSIKCITSHVFSWWQKSISQWHLRELPTYISISGVSRWVDE